MSSSRRRFLTGQIALDALREQGEQIADSLKSRPLPFSGDTVRLETEGMACPWAVVLNPGDPARVLPASDALREVNRLEQLLSVYRPESPVSLLNERAGRESQPVDAELWQLLDRCRSLHAATGGAFDPATQALIVQWRASRQEGRIPKEVEIEAALSASGMPQVVLGGDPLSGTVRFESPGLGLNFGAIGKGYAIDCIVSHLQSNGLTDALVHGGHSSVWGMGDHFGQGGWPVGLKNPLFVDESYLLLLLRDQAMGTSGSNIQYFRHEGRRYGHILDPRTGWPADQLLSVSVLAPTAAEADALSTAFYVLGLEKAVEYCHTHTEVGAILTPPVERGRSLSPIVCNIPAEQVFCVSDEVTVRWR